MTQEKTANHKRGIDRFLVGLFGVLPIHAISRLVGRLAASRISRPLIPVFARYYNINTSEAEKLPESYPSLSDFFVRKLKSGIRQVSSDEQEVVSPVDGVVGAAGVVTGGQLFQAKGVYYSLGELLGGDSDTAEAFEGGNFITIYLSPRDYHRIHMPFTARVVTSVYVPGTLFPVNAFGVRAVAGLFAKNERLITYLSGYGGLTALIKVGAAIVGSIKVVYDELPERIRGGQIVRRQYLNVPELAKGEELGRFEFGSTVLILFPKGMVRLDEEIIPGKRVRMGSRLGELRQDF